jgi:hypothetical protein
LCHRCQVPCSNKLFIHCCCQSPNLSFTSLFAHLFLAHLLHSSQYDLLSFLYASHSPSYLPLLISFSPVIPVSSFPYYQSSTQTTKCFRSLANLFQNLLFLSLFVFSFDLFIPLNVTTLSSRFLCAFDINLLARQPSGLPSSGQFV